jgi:hypothetical protein
MKVNGKVKQPLTIRLDRRVNAIAIILHHQLRQLLVLDGFDHATTGDATSQNPIGDAALQLRGSIPSRAADFLERPQPEQFSPGPLQLPALNENRRRGHRSLSYCRCWCGWC